MPRTKVSDRFPTEAEQAAWWAGYSTSEQAVERLIEALREAVGKAALTFSDMAVALELLRHETMAEACRVAEEEMRAALERTP